MGRTVRNYSHGRRSQSWLFSISADSRPLPGGPYRMASVIAGGTVFFGGGSLIWWLTGRPSARESMFLIVASIAAFLLARRITAIDNGRGLWWALMGRLAARTDRPSNPSKRPERLRVKD